MGPLNILRILKHVRLLSQSFLLAPWPENLILPLPLGEGDSARILFSFFRSRHRQLFENLYAAWFSCALALSRKSQSRQAFFVFSTALTSALSGIGSGCAWVDETVNAQHSDR